MRGEIINPSPSVHFSSIGLLCGRADGLSRLRSREAADTSISLGWGMTAFLGAPHSWGSLFKKKR